jgi:hypothetical protein
VTSENPTVTALRGLSIFSADQGGAYREHYAEFSAILGADVETRLGLYTREWAHSRMAGATILTGNAGTGKTAVAEAYCRALGASLPPTDTPVEVAPGSLVIKDLSGLPDEPARTAALREALATARAGGQALVCANEGVLRDSLPNVLDGAGMLDLLNEALRVGAAGSDDVTIVNVNRQRPTAEGLWDRLLDYLTREELWRGCDGCPFEDSGCPMRSNAAALRKPEVRESLRTLVRLGAGEAVPTLREVLAIVAWAIVGPDSCESVKMAARDQDKAASTAEQSYYSRLLGGGLTDEEIERSPLLVGMRRAMLGFVSDLQVDQWLRDTSGARSKIKVLAGAPEGNDPLSDTASLSASRSPLDRVRTPVGTMTFHGLGEMVATSEDPNKVDGGLEALVGWTYEPGSLPRLALWRQRVFFEGADAVGGHLQACRRLLEYRFVPELAALAHKTARAEDTVLDVTELVTGLNFLVTGFSSPNEGLVVPDPACLFARNPGSYRPASPSLVHGRIGLDRLVLRVPDRGLVEDVLDVDHVDVELVAANDDRLTLRIGPQMYEAIREAAAFRGPVGQGVAEMNDLRGFYGRLAATTRGVGDTLRVADPDAMPPALITVTLPHFIERLHAGEAEPESEEEPTYAYEEIQALTERQLRIRTSKEEITGTLVAWGDNGLALDVRRGSGNEIVFIDRDKFVSAARITRRRKSAHG